MKIIFSDENLTLKNTAVALGNFDGVHIAHKNVITEAVNYAKKNNLTSVVFTFFEHPGKMLGKEIKLLTTNSEKEQIFHSFGVDVLVYQKSESNFLNMQPVDFINNVIMKKLGAEYVVVGEHYSFGINGSGNSSLLKKQLNDLDVKVNILPLISIDCSLVSSSRIRELLTNGEIKETTTLLGREFAINGTVVHGNHIGSALGFPTANINFEPDKIVPKYGVYVCFFEIKNVKYNAIANIGIKPTVGSDAPLIEIHVLDCIKDFYEKEASVHLLDFIREEKKFETLKELKNQISKDIEYATEYFKQNYK